MFRPRLALALAFIALFSLGAVTPARAWWNGDWAFRKEITFNLAKDGADIPGNVSDVPVLIRLSLGNFGYFGDTKPDGSDLRFVAADDKTPLKHHIERYDSQAQIAFVWVQVPRLAGGAKADKIYLYYGNPKASGSADTGTYDVNQALVYHFGAAADKPQDATSYKNDPGSFKAEVNKASLIGAGAKFNGSQTISVPASASLRFIPSKGVTVSLWARPASQQSAWVAALQEQDKALVLGFEAGKPYARFSAGTVNATAQSATALPANEWHHLALKVENNHLTLLVDGAEAGAADAPMQSIDGALTLGGSAQGTNGYTGELDEVSVAGAARSNDWIRAAALSQGMVAPLVVYGGDTQKDSGGSQSYFGATLRNVTVDGWVIIGLLMVMFFVSVAVMVGKAVYLSRVGQGNAKFLAEFRKLSDDPTALERPESEAAFGISTLWNLYDHGTRETQKRLAGQAAGAARAQILSAQSIEAIRATLDASLTRMTQRLGSQMVLLTIAIAGGPFLGLLGTVVGVMITFAAIAATGDVNINAIAPGTAAALVATVAGLGVAIPCLFGYNYLNTRVKEIIADMRVFVDEYVTRIAETHS